MKSRSFLPMVVRMTTSRNDDVILRSEATKDLLFPDEFLLKKRIYALVAQRRPRAMKKSLSFTVVWLVLALASLELRGQNPPLVLQGGTLIDGTGAKPVPNAVIVLEGSRIKSVGTKGQVSYPANSRVIQVDGKTILPGLIDSHMHFHAWMPQLFLHFGVTTVYDTNNATEWIIAQRNAFKSGRIKGPRMFVTGGAIDGPPERSDLNQEDVRAGYAVSVRTPEEASEAVRKRIAQGVDAIRVNAGLRSELLKSVVDEARRAGLPVVGHSYNTREATLAGLKFIEHTTPIARATITQPEKLKEIEEKDIGRFRNETYPEYMMDSRAFDPLIRLLVKEGVYLNVTLGDWWGVPSIPGRAAANPRVMEWAEILGKLAKNPQMEFVPPEMRQSWSEAVDSVRRRQMDPGKAEMAEGFKKAQEFTRKFAAAGGKVVAGSATGRPFAPGLGLFFEMQSLVDAGLTPMQAILGATKWAAELFHKETDLGTLEAGKLADITVVDGDPLQDIMSLQNVHLVIKDGEIVDTTLDPKFKNPLPRTVITQWASPDPGPEITAIAPRVAREGDGEVTVEVTGKKFNPRSEVRFDTTALETQFVNDSKLTATITRISLRKVGSYAITVVNPGSGGGTSNVKYFLVDFRD